MFWVIGEQARQAADIFIFGWNVLDGLIVHKELLWLIYCEQAYTS